MWRRRRDPLDEIESAALNSKTDLPDVLRRCVALGGRTGSVDLRAWASKELKGYDGTDDLPRYRRVVAPLYMDGVTPRAQFSRQMMSADLIPDWARDSINESVDFAQGVHEIQQMLQRSVARADVIKLSPPGMAALLPIINDAVGPYQYVERFYWAVSPVVLEGILDVVRTSLVELVAEMRAATPSTSELPTREAADNAVSVVIKGRGHRVAVAAGDANVMNFGDANFSEGESETRGRRVMYWLVGVATIVAAIAGVIVIWP